MLRAMAIKSCRDSVVALLRQGYTLASDRWIVPDGYTPKQRDVAILQDLHHRFGFPHIACYGPEDRPPRGQMH